MNLASSPSISQVDCGILAIADRSGYCSRIDSLKYGIGLDKKGEYAENTSRPASLDWNR